MSMHALHHDIEYRQVPCVEHANCVVMTGDTSIPHHFRVRAPRRVNLNGHSILMEFHAERQRAHGKHQADSMEAKHRDDPRIFGTWIEEVMEAVQAHVDISHGVADWSALRKELVQVGAMTEAWVQAIDDE